MITIGILERAKTLFDQKKSEYEMKVPDIFRNEKGNVGVMMEAGITAIVVVVVVSILASAMIPSAVSAIIGTNTTNWGSGAIAIWSAITVIIVLCVLLIFVGIVMLVMKMADSR